MGDTGHKLCPHLLETLKFRDIVKNNHQPTGASPLNKGNRNGGFLLGAKQGAFHLLRLSCLQGGDGVNTDLKFPNSPVEKFHSWAQSSSIPGIWSF